MSTAPLRYSVAMADPAGHVFEVTLVVANPDPNRAILRLPAWIPGSYTVRDFARNIVRIAAHDDAGPVTLTKLDKDSWQAAPCTGPLTVVARVYAWDLSVRAAHLDASHAFFNGTSLFLVPDGARHLPCELVIEAPEDPACAGWKVATTLPRASGSPWGFGTFSASDYDALIDHPVEIGTWTHVRFEAEGIPHDVVITGVVRVDLGRLATDLAAICATHLRFFGKPAPFERYLFLVMAVGDGYGGLEHRSSTALLCKRTDLPAPELDEVSDAYIGFLGLCSHEYFHAWNVKRILPAVFVPYDLWQPRPTTQLWAFEGVTSYFDDLGLLRSRRITEAQWLELIGRTVTGVLRTPGRLMQTLADSSFDAWTKYYKQDENSPNALISYYTKGSLVALALDLLLQRASSGSVGLGALWRALWQRYGDGSGVPEGAIERLASELAGADLSGFFDRALRSTEDLPLADLLNDVGLTLRLRAATGSEDRGGKPAPSGSRATAVGDLGVSVGAGASGAILKHVLQGGAGHAAGLSAGDVVVALDGLRVEGSSLAARVRALPAGTEVTLHGFRRDELRTWKARLQAAPATTAWLEPNPDAPPEAVARRTRWLAGEPPL